MLCNKQEQKSVVGHNMMNINTTFEQDFDSRTFTYLELQTRNIYALNLDLEMNLDTLVDTLDTHTHTNTHTRRKLGWTDLIEAW